MEQRKKKGNKLVEIRALWETTAGNWTVGTDLIHEVEAVINSQNIKWGRGRLRLAANPELRAKFDSQWNKFHNAVWYGTFEQLRDECSRMKRALAAIEQAALGQGLKPEARAVWVVGLSKGRTMALVPTIDDSWHAALPDGCMIWSVEELSRIVEAQDDITQALKGTFKGSELTIAPTRKPQFVKDEPEDIR